MKFSKKLAFATFAKKPEEKNAKQSAVEKKRLSLERYVKIERERNVCMD